MLQTIDSLPPELLVSVLVCGSTYDLGRMSCACRSFRTLVEVALRQRAGMCDESDAPLPEGEVSWTQLLSWRERRRPRCGTVLAAGRMHSAFADAEGRLLTCGTDGDGHGFLGHGDEVVGGSITTPLPLGSLGWPVVRVVAVAAHTMHSLALSADGTVFAFGQGRCGKLGHGGEATEWRPRRVAALEHEHVVGVAAGQQHSLVLTREGGVYSFGSGFAGKLGHGDRRNQLLPRLVEALRGVKVAMVAAGSYHSLVVAEGSAYSFGDGVMGQLGHGDRHEHLVPKRITALERVRSAVGGEKHSIALDDSGAPSRLVGCNPVYLGCNPLSPGCNPLPLGCSPLSPGCNPLSAGALFAFGAGKDGRLGVGHDVRPCSRCNAGPGLAHSPMACADGRQAPLHVPPQVGHGVLEELLLPRRIASLRGVRAIAIAAGTEHSLVLADGGVVYSFGAGGGGKLGHGDARFQWVPTRVRALPPSARVVAIAAGDAHSLCALADGRVFGWGSGGLGMGLQPAEDPTTTVDHPPTDQQQLNTPGLADIALADVAIGSAGNQYIPAASMGSRRTLLPLALERRAVTPDAPGLSQLTTPWPAWPQEPVRNAHSSQRQRVRGCA